MHAPPCPIILPHEEKAYGVKSSSQAIAGGSQARRGDWPDGFDSVFSESITCSSDL